MARSSKRFSRRIVAVGTVTLSSAVLFLSTGLASASDPGSGDAGEDRVIVCESGVVDHGDGIETSAAIAIRVSDVHAETAEGVPPGCRSG